MTQAAYERRLGILDAIIEDLPRVLEPPLQGWREALGRIRSQAYVMGDPALIKLADEARTSELKAEVATALAERVGQLLRQEQEVTPRGRETRA